VQARDIWFRMEIRRSNAAPTSTPANETSFVAQNGANAAATVVPAVTSMKATLGVEAVIWTESRRMPAATGFASSKPVAIVSQRWAQMLSFGCPTIMRPIGARAASASKPNVRRDMPM
jgi:hypothetical protein